MGGVFVVGVCGALLATIGSPLARRFEIAQLLLRLWQREDCRQSILKVCGGHKFQAFLGAIFDTLLYQLNDGLSRLVNVRHYEIAKESEQTSPPPPPRGSNIVFVPLRWTVGFAAPWPEEREGDIPSQ